MEEPKNIISELSTSHSYICILWYRIGTIPNITEVVKFMIKLELLIWQFESKEEL